MPARSWRWSPACGRGTGTSRRRCEAGPTGFERARGPGRGAGSPARWRRPPSCCALAASGSRPIAGTRSCWPAWRATTISPVVRAPHPLARRGPVTWCARAPGARGDLIEGPPPPAPGCCCAAGSSMTAPGARNPDPAGALGAACPPRPRDRHGAQCAGAPDDARPAGTVVHTTARRDRLDEAIAGLPRRRRAPPPPPGVWPAFALSALTAVSLAVEIGDQGRFKGSTIACLPRPGPLRAPLRGSRPASRGPITKTREHPRPAPADRGRPDATPPPTGPPRPYGRAAALAPAPVAERADAGNRRQTRPLPGPDRPPRRSTPWSPPPSPDRAPAGCGPWQPWTPRTSTTTTTSTTSTTGTAQPGTQEP